MLLLGFIIQKLVANYFPKKADPVEVEKTKRILRKRKELIEQAKQAEMKAKTAIKEEKETDESDAKKLVKDERNLDLSQLDDNEDEDVDH